MSSLLEGKVALVSGVGPGLGRAISLALAQQGASLALSARTESSLVSVASEIDSLGGRSYWQQRDIADLSGTREFVDSVLEEFGHIDILVNNGHHKGDFLPLSKSSVTSWPEIFAVNTFGPMQLIQEVLAPMRSGGGGAIVNVNSGAAVNSTPGLGAYSASKSGLASLTRTLALEVGCDNIRVNGVYVSSMMGDNLLSWGATVAHDRGITTEEWLETKQRDEFALQRMPAPEDIADVILFLSSDLSRSVTGQNISANNGQWVVGPQ
jgi:NAD(P)-dependent dehydrogenase (short-subunit alcohol dehydrogenase family)